ncbi:MAG: zinc ABC transporter substrate-binding protein [Bacilli bacterium]|nr:zinc ABC transporter substrate-binding protein [Bacilli bacterium]
MKLRFLFLLSILTGSISGCDLGKDYSKTIFTSFYPVYDFAKRIAGDKFDIVNITPAGIEPHDYEPSARTITNICDSDGLLINGIGMEAWTDSLPKEAKNKIQVVTKDIVIRKINEIDDQHVWLNPDNAIIEMKNIKDYFCDIDVNNSDYYEQNYLKAKSDFEALTEEIEDVVSSLTIRQIVVSHAAFGYMCDRFNLEQIYINGLEPEEEPSAKTIEEIIDKVQKYNINTVYTEELVSKDIANKIAEETHVKTDILYTLEGLTEDQIGKEDYISLMKKNFEKIGRSNK